MTANQPSCMQVDKWDHCSIESFPPVLEDGNGNKLWMFLIILFLLRFAFVGNILISPLVRPAVDAYASYSGQK